MEQFEKIIKLALEDDLKGKSLEKAPDCPTELELAGYLSGHIPRKRKDEVASHLASCMACLEDMLLAEKVSNVEGKMESGGKNYKNSLKKNLWLFLAIVSFISSFIYSRYFLQLLVATLVLSAKWIFETVNAKILITIYDAWRSGGEKEVSKVLERVQGRIK